MKFLYLLLTILIFSSCLSNKSLTELGAEEPTTVNFEGGFYSNCADYTSGCSDHNQSLLGQLTFKLKIKDTLINKCDLTVNLIKHKKSLEIIALDNDNVVMNRKVKGKWKDDIFYSKRMIRPLGIPLLYFWYYEKKISIKFSESELTLVNLEYKMGMVLIMAAGNDDYTRRTYKNIK